MADSCIFCFFLQSKPTDPDPGSAFFFFPFSRVLVSAQVRLGRNRWALEVTKHAAGILYWRIRHGRELPRGELAAVAASCEAGAGSGGKANPRV